MGNSFGTLIVKLALSARQDAFAANPACPLCKEPMEGNGSAWFCSTPEKHREWLRERMGAAYEAQSKGQPVFFADLKHSPSRIADHYTWDPEMQGVILAVCPQPQENGQEVAPIFFSTIRGFGGRTNFRIDYPAKPGFVPQVEDWIWAEWAKEEIATG